MVKNAISDQTFNLGPFCLYSDPEKKECLKLRIEFSERLEVAWLNVAKNILSDIVLTVEHLSTSVVNHGEY